MTNPLSSYQAVCRQGSGAGAFFTSILVWGVGIGCFGAAFNNFLVETYDINGFDRGVLEFLRETPGVLLVAIFAALHRFSDWKVLRIGTACSLIAAMLLLVPVRWAWAVAFIVVWALGEQRIDGDESLCPHALRLPGGIDRDPFLRHLREPRRDRVLRAARRLDLGPLRPRRPFRHGRVHVPRQQRLRADRPQTRPHSRGDGGQRLSL